MLLLLLAAGLAGFGEGLGQLGPHVLLTGVHGLAERGVQQALPLLQLHQAAPGGCRVGVRPDARAIRLDDLGRAVRLDLVDLDLDLVEPLEHLLGQGDALTLDLRLHGRDHSVLDDLGLLVQQALYVVGEDVVKEARAVWLYRPRLPVLGGGGGCFFSWLGDLFHFGLTPLPHVHVV